MSPEPSKDCAFTDTTEIKCLPVYLDLFFCFVLLNSSDGWICINCEEHFKLPLLLGHFSYFNFYLRKQCLKIMTNAWPLFTPLLRRLRITEKLCNSLSCFSVFRSRPAFRTDWKRFFANVSCLIIRTCMTIKELFSLDALAKVKEHFSLDTLAIVIIQGCYRKLLSKFLGFPWLFKNVSRIFADCKVSFGK